MPVTEKSDSIIRVKRNAYSVSSKYIGLDLEVRIHQDHLELWDRNECVERMPRLFGCGKEANDFRHVIDSLVHKPGAFLNYKYVNHMYSTTRFRMAYDQLLSSTTEASAVKQYLKLLHAAKHEGLDLIDDALRWFLTEGKAIRADDVLSIVKAQQQLPAPTDVNVDTPDLSEFDCLLPHKQSDRWQKTAPQGERYHCAPCSIVTHFCHHRPDARRLAQRSIAQTNAPSPLIPTRHCSLGSPPTNEHK